VHDAIRTWQARSDRQLIVLGAPGPPRDLGLRFVAFFDEEPGGGPAGERPELDAHARGGAEEWVRYPVADAEQCRNQDVLRFVRSRRLRPSACKSDPSSLTRSALILAGWRTCVQPARVHACMCACVCMCARAGLRSSERAIERAIERASVQACVRVCGACAWSLGLGLRAGRRGRGLTEREAL
jgi:hypothetical protein